MKVAPAMQAGLTDHLWEMEDIGTLITHEASKTRGAYKKKNANDVFIEFGIIINAQCGLYLEMRV